MKFINERESTQVRESDGSGYKWNHLKKGEEIDLPEKVGQRHKFKRVTNQLPISHQLVTEGKIGEKKVETKQFELGPREGSFYKELIEIQGIGQSTAEDIISIFTRKQLIKAITRKQKLPFRDDIEKKLRRKYGN